MSEPVWLSYMGVITGVVGAITGIAGVIMGYIGYRRTDELKALDLRLELRRAENDLRSIVDELPTLMDHSMNSRQRVAAATGNFGSGRLKQFEAEYKTDRNVAKSLQENLTNKSADFTSFSHSMLEEKLAAIHAQYLKASGLRDKYHGAVAEDDKERDHLRAQHRAGPNAN